MTKENPMNISGEYSLQEEAQSPFLPAAAVAGYFFEANREAILQQITDLAGRYFGPLYNQAQSYFAGFQNLLEAINHSSETYASLSNEQKAALEDRVLTKYLEEKGVKNIDLCLGVLGQIRQALNLAAQDSSCARPDGRPFCMRAGQGAEANLASVRCSAQFGFISAEAVVETTADGIIIIKLLCRSVEIGQANINTNENPVTLEIYPDGNNKFDVICRQGVLTASNTPSPSATPSSSPKAPIPDKATGLTSGQIGAIVGAALSATLAGTAFVLRKYLKKKPQEIEGSELGVRQPLALAVAVGDRDNTRRNDSEYGFNLDGGSSSSAPSAPMLPEGGFETKPLFDKKGAVKEV